MPLVVVVVGAEDVDGGDGGDVDALLVLFPLALALLLLLVAVPLPPGWELEEASDDDDPVTVVDDDDDDDADDPLLVGSEPVIEPLVIVEFGKNVDEKLVCVELRGILVPVPEPVLVEVGKVPVDVLFETIVVDDDADPDPGADRVEVTVPELDCVFVEADETLELGVELDLDDTVLVPFSGKPLEVDSDVVGPDPDVVRVVTDLVLVALVDEVPVIDDIMVVVVMLPETLAVELPVAVVVVEFEAVIEVDVPLLVVDMPVFVALPLTELRIIDLVAVIVAPFVSVLVTVVRLPELEDEPLAVVNPEFVVVPLELGPLVREVVVAEILPPELLITEVLTLPEVVGELDVTDVVFVPTAPFEEEAVNPLEVCVPELDRPDELTVGLLAVTVELLVGSVSVIAG